MFSPLAFDPCLLCTCGIACVFYRLETQPNPRSMYLVGEPVRSSLASAEHAHEVTKSHLDFFINRVKSCGVYLFKVSGTDDVIGYVIRGIK